MVMFNLLAESQTFRKMEKGISFFHNNIHKEFLNYLALVLEHHKKKRFKPTNKKNEGRRSKDKKHQIIFFDRVSYQ